MQTLDLIIIFGYLIGVTLFGVWFWKRKLLCLPSFRIKILL
ncbi:MAG: hypothetical protein ACR2IA_05805 [Pyrinomonadaceae bacterium]